MLSWDSMHCFCQVVLIDTDTLASLPDRELASGISEIIKYGLIRCVPVCLQTTWAVLRQLHGTVT